MPFLDLFYLLDCLPTAVGRYWEFRWHWRRRWIVWISVIGFAFLVRWRRLTHLGGIRRPFDDFNHFLGNHILLIEELIRPLTFQLLLLRPLLWRFWNHRSPTCSSRGPLNFSAACHIFIVGTSTLIFTFGDEEIGPFNLRFIFITINYRALLLFILY